MSYAETEGRWGLNFVGASRLFQPAVAVLIGLMIAGLALFSWAGEFTISWLALSPAGIMSGKLWQLVTYSMVNSPCSILFNGLVVLFLGSAVERQWRWRSVVALMVTVSVACGLVWLALGFVLGQNIVGLGTTACAYGLIAAFGLLYWGTKVWFFFWILEAQYLALLFIGIGIVLSIPQPMGLIWVLGAAVAYGYVKLAWRRRTRVASRPKQEERGFVDVD